MKLLRAAWTLFWLSFRRLVWSTNTLMVLFPLAAGALFVFRRHYDLMAPDSAARDFSEFLILVFASFLIPVCALAYGTASIGGDREDGTLLFLLVRPIPRTLVLLSKFAATIPLVLGLVLGTFFVYCHLAGAAGQTAWELFVPSILIMAAAYLGLFQLFAVALRHSTIAALIYALFMEVLLGNMPGIVKRVAVNYYGRSLMYAVGASQGLERPPWFEPISRDAAVQALAGIAGLSLLAAIVIFHRSEYRDSA
jgi:ABC-2 type transport system permease protein